MSSESLLLFVFLQYVNMCVLLKKKIQGKGFFTVLTTKTLFPLVKHHVFIKSFGSVGLSTLNTNTGMLFFLYLVDCPHHVSIQCSLPLLIS